ncbi:MAG: ABC transporter ATP-binding protein [Syntrophobacteraceae bacterium]
MPPLLHIKDIRVRYSGVPVIHGVSFDVFPGETVCMVGSNGAGKSTILRAIMGALPVYSGSISFDGKQINGIRTEAIVQMGVIYVPEERMLFKPFNVEENLLLGAYSPRARRGAAENLESAYALFPRLRERRSQAASTLSGGEQQMLAIGRGLMSDPRILMLDEPSLGLSPILVDELFETIVKLKRRGLTILLVEQNVRESLEIGDRGYVLQSGMIVEQGTGNDLLCSEVVRKAFLGL